MKPEELLDKYFRGETSMEEEKQLKQIMSDNKISQSELAMFSFFEEESRVPDNLEKIVFQKLENKMAPGRKLRLRIIRTLSAAAVILIAVTFYINQKNTRNNLLEKKFSIMEQALYQVSQNIQPEEQHEMFVLWVDDDVQIIIN